jgi:branched-chain amino acid transport system substrate-binding protein
MFAASRPCGQGNARRKGTVFMMTRNFLRGFVAGSMFVVALSGTTPARSADDDFEIHAIVSLTGLASFIGTQDKVTLGLGEKLINETGGIRGRKVKFIYHDDQSSPQLAVQLLNDIVSAKPAVILGPNLSATCNAVAPLLPNGPTDYCLSPALTPAKGSYVFSTMTSTADAIASQIRYFRMKGWTRLALLTSTDATGQDNERATDEALKLPENAGIQIVERAHFNPSDVSVAAQLERIKGAQPEAFMAWTAGTPLATVLKGIIQVGLDLPVAVNNANMIYAQMNQYQSFLPKRLYIAAPEWLPHDASLHLDAKVEAAQQEFYSTFKNASLKPDLAQVSTWDPMLIVVTALRTLGPDATSAQIRDYIAHLKGYAGINGLYDFEKYPQRGLSEDNVVVTRWSTAANTWQVVSKPTGIPTD